MTAHEPLILFNAAAGTIVVETAIECPGCHSMHFFLKNKNGRTTCLDCADPGEPS